MVFRRLGFQGFLASALDRGLRRSTGVAPLVDAVTRNAKGLEIGGPSSRFATKNLVPVYPHVRSLDNVNFADHTLWEEAVVDLGAYAPEGRILGTQYVQEASELRLDGQYDFVVSSHTLEHLANPLKSLSGWRRLTSPGGFLILVVPHRDGTFDRHRPVTELTHLIADRGADVDESDSTHFAEILRLHDHGRDPETASGSTFEERLAENSRTRSAHHHVFDVRLVLSALAESGWDPVSVEARRPYDIIAVARNPVSGQSSINSTRFLGSPFPSDRTPVPSRLD